MTSIPPLSKDEAADARRRAERGEILPLEILRRFVATIRKSYTALPKEAQSKTREKTPPPDDRQIDFF